MKARACLPLKSFVSLGKKQNPCYSAEIPRCFSVLPRPCVGITTAPPEEMQWFCSKCANKKKDKKHKKRKHKAHWGLRSRLEPRARRRTDPITGVGGEPSLGLGTPEWTGGKEMLSGSGRFLSQTGRAQGVGFLVHSDAVFRLPRDICTERYEALGNSWYRSRSRGSAATKMNVVNTDICPILSRFVINPSRTFAVRCWEEEKM